MAQSIQTHINAFYAELAAAKVARAEVDLRISELEQTIEARGYALPLADGSIPEKPAEDAAHSDDVSAAEQKPLDKYNREELDAYALDHGVENPAKYETKKDLIEAIQVAEAAGSEI